jgi:fatty-acid desaturase
MCLMATTSEPARRGLSRPSSTNPVQIYWPYAINLVLVHLIALLALFPWFFSWTGVATCLAGLYVFGTLGINLGFHRLLTHRSLVVPKWLEYCLATLAVCCLQDAPARWVAIHRLHHQHSDEEPDPHSPQVNIFWGHVGWVFLKNTSHDHVLHYERYSRDLLRDPYYFWIACKLRWFWIYAAHAALFFGIGLLVGRAWTGDWSLAGQFAASVFVWGVFVRTVLVWHITWIVNSLGHVIGYQNYETGDSSRNNWLFALISNGDGWHNNHHAYQHCAAHGHKWWEFDVTYLTILALEYVGLATNVVKHPLAKTPRPSE